MDCADYEETHLYKRVDLCALRNNLCKIWQNAYPHHDKTKCSVF